MLNFLRHRTGLRGAIGVVAAYALALQMLFAGLAGAQMVSADPAGHFVICFGTDGTSTADSGTPGSKRINHISCVVCGVASLAPPLLDTVTPAVFRSGVAAAYLPLDSRPSSAARRHEPKSAQGPPQNA